MKALAFNEFGGPDKLKLQDVPDPKIKPTEVLVRVRACALNHLDLFVREGIPALKTPLPFWTGCDIAGEIAEVGAQVSGVKVGDRVAVNPNLTCGRCEFCAQGEDSLCVRYGILGEHAPGGLAEYVAVRGDNVLPLPAVDLVRGGRLLHPHQHDGVADGGHAGPAARRPGRADHRRGRRRVLDRGADRQALRRAGDRDVVQRRQARTGADAGRRRRHQLRHQQGLGQARLRGQRQARRGSGHRERGRGDLEGLHPLAQGRRTAGHLRLDVGPDRRDADPAGVLEAGAHHRLDHGQPEGVPGRHGAVLRWALEGHHRRGRAAQGRCGRAGPAGRGQAVRQDRPHGVSDAPRSSSSRACSSSALGWPRRTTAGAATTRARS